MDKFCEDCIHNSVCHYGAYCPSGHCNDKDTLDDLRPHGEWILMYCSCGDRYYTCSICNRAIEVKNGQSLKDYPYCHCGAYMQKGGSNG